MPARMPTLVAILATAAAMLALAPHRAIAEARAYDGSQRVGLPAPRHRHLLPPQPSDRASRRYEPASPPPGYGGAASLRAYLPRTSNVPLYNEPPPR